MKVTRRDFIATTAVGSASLALDLQGQSKPRTSAPTSGADRPGSQSSSAPHNGYNYLDRGYAVLTGGGDTLDAVMQVITGPEDDPNDDSVGLGGLPNEDCVVELDACCMHGPTRMAGSVAGRARDQECLAAVEDGDGAYRPRDAGGRRRAEVWIRHGLPQGESADRALAQDLATVARDHVERRLVGTGNGQSEIQVSRRQPATSLRTR